MAGSLEILLCLNNRITQTDLLGGEIMFAKAVCKSMGVEGLRKITEGGGGAKGLNVLSAFLRLISSSAKHCALWGMSEVRT